MGPPGPAGGGTVGAQAPNWLNAKDFGATGDGSTDDTAAIQNAINAAIDANGGTIYFPIGSYRITAPLTTWHGSPYTGNKLIRLTGERGHEMWGARLEGNFPGYIIDQSTDQIWTVKDMTGTFQVGELMHPVPPDGRESFPVYAVNSPTELLVQGGGDMFNPGERFDGINSGAAATMVAVAYNQTSLDRIDNLAIVNSSTIAGSGAIRIQNVYAGHITDCFIRGLIGVEASTGFTATISIQNCNIWGLPGAVGIGVQMGQCNVISCNMIGWGEAIRQRGFGGSIIGCRFEVCRTAIRTGTDQNGNTFTSSALTIQSNQLERCNTGFYLRETSGIVAGNGDSGNVNVDDNGPRDYGFRLLGACQGLTLLGNQCGGEVKVGFSLNSSDLPVAKGVALVGCFAANNGTKFDLSARDNPANIIELVACSTNTGPVT